MLLNLYEQMSAYERRICWQGLDFGIGISPVTVYSSLVARVGLLSSHVLAGCGCMQVNSMCGELEAKCIG